MDTSLESIQGLVVISFSQNLINKHFIEKIVRHYHRSNPSEELKAKSLSFGSDTNLNAFELKIDNKYYSANIFLFDINDKHIINKRFSDCVNGFLIYFDSNEEFDGIQSLQSYINQFNNEIKLLVSETIDETKRKVIEKWCLDNEFELIELCPQTDVNDDDFEDVDGMTRLLQAIQAYHWPNSTLKEGPQYNGSQIFNSLLNCDVNDSDISKQVESSEEESDQFQDIKDLEDFENLFEKFSEMKVKSSQMSETERKDYAERVTISFWKAIGGDIGEVEGLDDK